MAKSKPGNPSAGSSRPRPTAEQIRWRRGYARGWANCLKCSEPIAVGGRCFAPAQRAGLPPSYVYARLCHWCGEAMEREKAPPPTADR